MAYQSFFRELRRRHIFRVAIAYAVTAWLLLQLGAIVFPTLHAPSWCESVLLAFLVLGFPVSLLLAWAFESTPEGVRRTLPADSEEARPEATGRRLGRKIDFMIIVVLAAAVGVLAWRQFSAPAKGTVIPAKSIAVLPFENLSEDKNNGYFADGIQDLILTKLADIGDLAVISRTSTLQYGSHPENLQKVGQQLGVATILEGSVQKVGDQVLINVQLIDARTDHHIWARSYQRTLKNVFGVEGEVAELVANTLKAKLSPAETKRLATALSHNPKANDLYLRAEYFFAQFLTADNSFQDLKQAIAFYRQALVQAPGFALAHARLSFVESLLITNGGGGKEIKELEADARIQAEKAMQLAPDLAESHLAIGYYEYYTKGNYGDALQAFDVALSIRPNDADAIAARGLILRRQGKFDKAIGVLRRALELNPRSTDTTVDLASTYMAIDRYAEAGQTFQQAIALSPHSIFVRSRHVDFVVFSTGDVSRALRDLPKDDTPNNVLNRAGLLALQRNFDAAITLLQSVSGSAYKNSGVIAFKRLELGDLYRYSGYKAQAKTYYAKALPDLRTLLKSVAGSPIIVAKTWNHIANAELGQGKTQEGIAAIEAALAAGQKSGDHFEGPGIVVGAAINYAEAGRADKAVPLITHALETPGIGVSYSPVMLWIDPAWDPIRKRPGFKALEKKYASYRPAIVPKASTG